jgi:hypothetical protein
MVSKLRSMVAVANQSATTFADLLSRADTTQASLASFLDGLDPATRVAQSIALTSKPQQKRLWELCQHAPALPLETMVPASTPDGQEVIWAGMNTLPIFKVFEKRFMRVNGTVIGYNKQTTSWITGPGYFTLVVSPHEQRELRVDYTNVPTATPAGWPTVKPNDRGLSNLVYKNLYDYLRFVSRDVVIGFATRLDKPMDSYFILARR